MSIPEKDAAWKAAVRQWGHDDMSDQHKTIMCVEAVLYAASDLILALEARIEELATPSQQAA